MLLRFPDLPHAGRSEVMVSIGTTSPENNAHAPSAGIGGIPVGRTGELGGSQCNVRHAAAPFFFSASAKSTALTTWISTYVKGKAIKILICAAHAVNLIYQRPPPPYRAVYSRLCKNTVCTGKRRRDCSRLNATVFFC